MYKRVLVTGGNGLLGTKTIGLLLSLGRQPISVSLEPDCLNRFLGDFPYRSLDITDPAAISSLFAELKPEAVVHTAAFTAVDACETQRDLSWRVNVDGSANVALGAAEAGARLVHVSTEYVFDGANGPYTEDDLPNPISHYGRTKLESEKAVKERCRDWVIGRTTVLFGDAPNVRPSFVRWLVDNLREGKEVRIVDDQISSPTLAENLAEMLLALLDSGKTGTYNTVGDSILDRYSFSTMIARVYGLDAGPVRRVKTSDLNQPAPRPLKAGLIMEKFKREFPSVRVLTAEESLLRLRDS